MKRWVMGGAVALLGLLALSCSGTSKLTESWADPTYTPKPVSKFMIVGLGESSRRIMLFEDYMARQFATRKGLEVIKGSSVKATESGDVEAFKNVVRGSGADLVSITRLIGVDEETAYVPGSTAYVPTTGYYGMGPYYGSTYAMVNEPGYAVNYKIYKLETNVYDVKTEKLIWSGLSHTTDPADLEQAISSMAMVVVNDLVARKIIQ
jgi:hypothetical protein